MVCRGSNRVPLKDVLTSQPPVPVNATRFGNRVFARGNRVKMRSWGWAPIQHYWCPHEKEEQRDTEPGMRGETTP